MYQTLGSVFPKIETWQTQEGDLLLVASQQLLPFDVDVLRERLAQEPFKTAMRVAWSAIGVEDFLAHHIGNTDVAATLQQVESWPLNTDDRTVIEFAVARSLSAADGFRIGNLRASAHTTHRDRPNILLGELDWSRVEEGRISAAASTNPAENTESLTKDQRARAMALVAYMRGDLTEAFRFWRSQPDVPRTLPELRLVAECLASEGNPALDYIDRLASIAPAEADAIRSELYWKQGRIADATQSLEKFLRAAHEDPWANQDIIRRSLWRAEMIAQADGSKKTARVFYDLLRTPLAIWNCESDRRLRLLTLGTQLDGAQVGTYTTPVLELFEPHVKWDLRFLELRQRCYRTTRNPILKQATRDLDDFLNNQALTADTSALAKLFEHSSNLPPAGDSPHLSAR